MNLALKNGPYLAKNSVNKIWSIWANFGKKWSKKKIHSLGVNVFFQSNRINLKLEETSLKSLVFLILAFNFYKNRILRHGT